MSPSRPHPHVDEVADWPAAQSLRLLWDRLLLIETKVHDLEVTSGDLVRQLAALQDRVDQAMRNAKEALAIAQLTPAEDATPLASRRRIRP